VNENVPNKNRSSFCFFSLKYLNMTVRFFEVAKVQKLAVGL